MGLVGALITGSSVSLAAGIIESIRIAKNSPEDTSPECKHANSYLHLIEESFTHETTQTVCRTCDYRSEPETHYFIL